MGLPQARKISSLLSPSREETTVGNVGGYQQTLQLLNLAAELEEILGELYNIYLDSRTCNAKAATVVREVLAMRLKVEGLEDGQGRGIHADVNKEIEKKGFQIRTKVWAVVNALRNNGIKFILDDDENSSRQMY
ncbi:hypothetical protein RJ641_008456 [Dillenia turbinata]|uniref:Uncharacterized protein n=1 Tax=Dillenia turbinata TaxID=194707 RepID=A0AAN8VCG2_9MAGN